VSEDLLVDSGLLIPGGEITYRASRSSGPGGQHVNTTDTRVELRWNVRESAVLNEDQRERLLTRLAGRINRNGELVLSCGTRRSQHRNREEVAARLARLVRAALVRPRRRVPSQPTREAREKRLREKKRRAETKRRRRPPDETD